jgi:HD-GYP domain-containing protein (c-di-GMP phosphodiesterase class II)
MSLPVHARLTSADTVAAVLLDSYDTPDAEALLLAADARVNRHDRRRRELVTHGIAAATFLIAAVLLAAIAPWHRTLSVSTLALVLAVWIVVERVKFPVAGGWTAPTMLVFVPALFVLPTPVVPLVAALALLLGRIPELAHNRAQLTMVPEYLADSWYTIGPALVIVLAGAESFSWSQWPVYLAALAAQLLFDLASTLTRCSIGEGIDPRVQLPLLSWMYLADAVLAPLGLLVAAAASHRPGLALLALSPTAMLWLFARERRERMSESLALSGAYRGTAYLLGDIVEADDHYTGVHSRDVVGLSVSVARELRLDSRRRRSVEFAALLHDVGKIRIPKEIINKPGTLDPDEQALVRKHPVDGEQMLMRVGGTLATVGRIVRASHERYDGGGYPDGLMGDQIPVEARIIYACDAFSAMTTDRPYRRAMDTANALAELRSCAGTQFDPAVIETIERLIAS